MLNPEKDKTGLGKIGCSSFSTPFQHYLLAPRFLHFFHTFQLVPCTPTCHQLAKRQNTKRRRWDSNPQSLPPESNALPLGHAARVMSLGVYESSVCDLWAENGANFCFTII